MLKIRLQKIGRKNDASFRVVLTDSKNAAKSGKFKEILGSYNVKKGDMLFKADRISHWMKNGAQVSVVFIPCSSNFSTGHKLPGTSILDIEICEHISCNTFLYYFL